MRRIFKDKVDLSPAALRTLADQCAVAFAPGLIGKIVRTLRSLAESAAIMGEWRPIDSAPKDGREILLYAPATTYNGEPVAERITQGQWFVEEGGVTEHRDLDGRWIGQDERQPWEGWISFDGGFTEEHLPTMWREMPPPPPGDAS